MCGESFNMRGEPRVKVGSPPRVRGKFDVYGGEYRFREDHPRVCGESAEALPDIIQQIRITPACAGKVFTS